MSTASSNKYNDPTLPGYDPSKPSGVEGKSQTKPASKQTTPPSTSASVNKYNDPTLPGYDPSKPVGTLMESASKQTTPPSTSASVNKYNDPTLPGYDPSKPVGTLMESASKQMVSHRSGANKYNDPTLPDYDPNWQEKGNAATTRSPSKRGPDASYIRDYNRGYFNAPKL
jgi:hypothetical protein